jgi:hypothetical protein
MGGTCCYQSSGGGGVEKQVKNVASDCLNIEHHSGNFCKHENFEIWKIQWKNNKNYLQNITTIQDRRVLSIHPKQASPFLASKQRLEAGASELGGPRGPGPPHFFSWGGPGYLLAPPLFSKVRFETTKLSLQITRKKHILQTKIKMKSLVKKTIGMFIWDKLSVWAKFGEDS